jgi:hypothetical protein
MTEFHPQRQLHTEMRRAPIGAMATGKRTETLPSYARTLLAVGLTTPRTTIADAFKIWARVCLDSVVLRTQKKIKEAHQHIVGKNLTHKALEAMSAAELSELKSRIENRSASSQK